MLTLLLGALFGAIVLLAPGWTVARAAGVGRLSALALAPAISAVILSAAQVLTSALSLHWMAWGPPVVIGLIAALGFPARVMRRKGWIRIGPTLAGSTRLRADQRAWLLGGAVVAGAVAVAAATAAPKASWPAQAYDVTFHVNAITVMREVGDASPFGGLWPIYQGYRVFYPTLWHAIAVFIPGSAIQATNALLLGCALFVWPALLTGMLAALRRTLGEGWARTTGLTVALASTTAAVPVLMTSLTVWPYVLSVLTLPGILAVLGTALRDILDRTCTPGTSLGALIVIGAGAVLAHGAGAFNVLAISLPFVAAAMHHVLRLGGRGRRIMLRVLPLLAAGALIGGWVMRQQVASVLSYQRPAGGWDGAAETVKRILLDVPQYGVVPPIAWIPAGALFTILVFMGAWQAHHDASLRPWVALWLMAVMIVLLTSGPAWPGRQIGAPWYLQEARIMPLATLPAILLAARGLSGLLAALEQRGPMWRRGRARLRGSALATAVVLAAVACRVPLLHSLVASVWDPRHIQHGTLATVDELVLLERSRSVLPDDAVVLGAPARGAGYVWPMTGLHGVYMSRSEPYYPSDMGSVALLWSDFGADESTTALVCGQLERLGVEYFLAQEDPMAAGAEYGAATAWWDAPLIRPPLRGVELVDSEGDATLWRITGCG